MSYSFHLPRFARAALGGVLLVPLALAVQHAHAADPRQLLATAAHNTNTVRTLVHTSTVVERSQSFSLTQVIHAQEDEVNNRERDSETVNAHGKDSTGKVKTVKYTLDVIFINGRTYYRASYQKNQWHERPGTSFTDAFTRLVLKRARTKVSTYPGTKFIIVSGGSGGTHLHAAAVRGASHGTVDLWLSGGSTPYVTKEDVQGTIVSNGQSMTQRLTNTYGPFNQPLKIQIPTQGA